MSQTSSTSTADPKERILDAAARRVSAVGVTRTTLTDVAKAAQLSRMTIYRNYPSIEAVLQDLMTREFNGVVTDSIAGAGEDAPVTRAVIVERTIESLDNLSAHPLFLRILEADPELLLPYITERPGRFQQHAQSVLASALEAGIAAGEIRRDDPERLASSMILAMRGFALTDKSSWSRKRRRAMLGDVARMFDAMLAPEAGR